jgi:hypothetical protein
VKERSTFIVTRTGRGRQPDGERFHRAGGSLAGPLQQRLVFDMAERPPPDSPRLSLPHHAVHRAPIAILAEFVDARLLANKFARPLDGQAGGELLAGERAAGHRHRIDSGRPADVAAELTVPSDHRVAALEHRTRVEPDTHPGDTR